LEVTRAVASSRRAECNHIEENMKKAIALLVSLGVVSVVQAAPPANLTTDKTRLGYTVGFQMSNGVKSQGLDIDKASFLRGVQDGINGAKPALTEQEMGQTVQKFREARAAKQQEVAQNNGKRGEEYLAKNKAKEGVKTLDSGVQYRVVKEGDGAMPKDTDTVTVHYRGTLIDGKEFDSSYKRNEPVSFQVKGVIPGWQQVLPLMKKGAKWEVAIPPGSAYGERGAGPNIGPNETLLFEIELIDIKS
jgi:FKBP-type peptidyl-prolyl cis-trans isomerase FklB